MAIVGEVT